MNHNIYFLSLKVVKLFHNQAHIHEYFWRFKKKREEEILYGIPKTDVNLHFKGKYILKGIWKILLTFYTNIYIPTVQE